MHCWNYLNVRKSIQDSKFAMVKLFNIMHLLLLRIEVSWDIYIALFL